jgi:hypothetical protein
MAEQFGIGRVLGISLKLETISFSLLRISDRDTED